MNTKCRAVLLAVTLCLSLAATAQTVVDFSGLPPTGTPQAIPSGYGGMNWANFDYITELLKHGTMNVAFPAFFAGPGPAVTTMAAVDSSNAFIVVGMAVSGEYNTTLTLTAYNQGIYVGSQSYPLAPVLTPIRPPSSWGAITEIRFACADSHRKAAIFNLSSVTFQ
jgi:hypothetical protein